MDTSTSRFLRSVSFRQLQVFESIARTGSFTAAARELYLTQPTVSQQMKKLEDGIGVTLFDQVGRKVYLTEEGKALLESCQSIFRSIDEFEDTVKGAERETGNLSLSGVTTTEYFFPLLLSIFCHRYPMVNIRVTINDRESILSRIQGNKDDLYLLSHIPDVDNLECEPFMDNSMVIVSNSQHPLVGKSDVTYEEIVNENFLLREENSGTCIALQNYLNEKKYQSKTRMRFNSNEAIKQGVINNLGIALLSIYVVQEELKEGKLKILNVEDFPLQENWYLARHKNKKLSPITQLFKEFSLGEGKDLILSTIPDKK